MTIHQLRLKEDHWPRRDVLEYSITLQPSSISVSSIYTICIYREIYCKGVTRGCMIPTYVPVTRSTNNKNTSALELWLWKNYTRWDPLPVISGVITSVNGSNFLGL